MDLLKASGCVPSATSSVDGNPRRRRSTKDSGTIRKSREELPPAIYNDDFSSRNEFQTCPFCGCRYKGKSSFTTHLRKKHPEMQEEIKCFVCASQVEKDQFPRHFRQHQEEDTNREDPIRTLHCDFCEFSCVLNVDMIQHIGSIHDENDSFSMARTQAQFLVNVRNCRHRSPSDDDSERTLSSTETPPASDGIEKDSEYQQNGMDIEENDRDDDLLVFLERGHEEFLQKGFTVVMLHHLLITPFERSWIKLLIPPGSKNVRVPITKKPLARDHDQLTTFVIENDMPSNLQKFFECDAWSYLQHLIKQKRMAYTCVLCNATLNQKVIKCPNCNRRYHQACNLGVVKNYYECSTCFI